MENSFREKGLLLPIPHLIHFAMSMLNGPHAM